MHDELIARLEKATGPDRTLDAAIVVALDVRPEWLKGATGEMWARKTLAREGRSPAYARRIFQTVRAAIRRAARYQEVRNAPAILVGDFAELQGQRDRDLILTRAEIGRWLDAADPHCLTFLVLLGATMARPGAILDLREGPQIDRARRLIDLNPPGRRQTKKYRPVVPMTEAARLGAGRGDAGRHGPRRGLQGPAGREHETGRGAVRPAGQPARRDDRLHGPAHDGDASAPMRGALGRHTGNAGPHHRRRDGHLCPLRAGLSGPCGAGDRPLLAGYSPQIHPSGSLYWTGWTGGVASSAQCRDKPSGAECRVTPGPVHPVE